MTTEREEREAGAGVLLGALADHDGSRLEVRLEQPGTAERPARITAAGALDTYSAPLLRTSLLRLLNSCAGVGDKEDREDREDREDMDREDMDVSERQTPPHLLLDMSHVDFIDSTGLGVLVEAHMLAKGKGGLFALVDLSLPVARVLEISRLNRLLTIVPSEPSRREDGTGNRRQ